jgi:hypothetical protein
VESPLKKLRFPDKKRLMLTSPLAGHKMSSKIDGNVEATFADFRRAGPNGSLDKVYADIEKSFAKLTPAERKIFLEHLNQRVHSAHLTQLDIDGIDTKHHRVLLTDHHAHNADREENLHRPESAPHQHADVAPHVPNSPEGPAKGLGVWMNMFHYPKDLKHVQSFAHDLQTHGVRNLYLETPGDLDDRPDRRERIGQLIDECHKDGIRVIAWYKPYLKNPKDDASDLADAAHLRTAHGGKFDGIAADLEVGLTPTRVREFSQELRREVGRNYSIGAITYSPLNGATDAHNTPWTEFSPYYNYIAPMDYWSGQHRISAQAYTTQTIEQVHNLTGYRYNQIYVIGDGEHTGNRAISDFLDASRKKGVTNVSLYPFNNVTASQFGTLKRHASQFD